MKNPETMEIGARRSPAETVKHVIYPVAEAQKTELLGELLKRVNYDSVIVFCRTKERADRIGNMLKKKNHAVAILHSNRTQREREQALEGFVTGSYEVLVATDIAARGLDIAQCQPCDQLRRSAASGGLRASDWPNGAGGSHRRRVHARWWPETSNMSKPSNGSSGKRSPGSNWRASRTIHRFIRRRQARTPGSSGRIQGVRLSGGYYFGPARSKKRRSRIRRRS